MNHVNATSKYVSCPETAAEARATLPRIRYDKLMSIGWKVLLPAATLNLLVTSAFVAWRA